MGRHTTIIELTDDQLKYVKKMRKAKSTCQTLRSRCQIFLDLDVNHGKQFTCEQCAHSNGISIKTVYTAIDKKIDSEYVRNGTCSIFAFVEPLAGWHHQSVREHRTAVDWAEEIKWLVDNRPEAKKIVLVMDNLNTHKIASLYKKYDPETARSIRRKLEIHYTPKHGSWLDMAEIELNMMTRQCLNRRIQDISILRKELSAWETDKNDESKKIVWQFRTEDARVKLISLYPKL